MSSDLMLFVPSLKPNRLRGVCCARDVDEVRPKPSCDQRTSVTPKPSRTRLRTACTATCGSSAQAWMHRSPPLRAGSSLSFGNSGRSTSCGGRLPAEAEPAVEQRRPEADGQRQVRRGQVERLAGVAGRRVVAAADGAVRDDLLARRHPAGRVGPRLQQLPQLLAVLRGDVEGREVQVRLGRGDDPGLVLPVEADGVHRRLGAARRLVDPDPGGGSRPGERDTRARQAEELPPRNPRALCRRHFETTSATLLSGSLSASTAEANSLTWSCDRSV